MDQNLEESEECVSVTHQGVKEGLAKTGKIAHKEHPYLKLFPFNFSNNDILLVGSDVSPVL